MHFQLAWRNIWRNPGRTVIILTAIIIGIWSMIFLGAFMRGMEVGMIKNGIATLTGNIQIHKKGYRNDPVIENSMTGTDKLKVALERALPPGAKYATRVRVNAIASNAGHSSGVTLVGIEPKREAHISFIGKSVTKGRYLKPGDKNKIVIGQALLDKLETKIGHKLVIMSQDTNHEIASKAFRIVGTFKAEMQVIEKQFVFVAMPAARRMLNLKKGVSEVSIALPELRLNNKEESIIAEKLKVELKGMDYDVETWQELLPMLSAYLKINDGFLYIWYLVVFIAMGFGIVNTTLMAIFERVREFGLLKALGMRPWWIIRGVLTESFFLLILGIVAGNILAFFSVLAFSKNGIDLSAFAAGAEMWGMSRMIFPEIWTKDLLIANILVFSLGLLVSIYPAAKAAMFTPVEALKKT
jgi:ABC-type lipoprotein release transport system permease subunit